MPLRYSRNQLASIILAPVLVCGAGVLATRAWGWPGLIAPLGMITGLLVILVLELRQYTLGLFVRSQEELRRTYAQIEAMMGIYKVLDPVQPLPRTRGWAASPDLLREVLMMIATDRLEHVVEASSGTSTIVIGYCLKRQGRGRVISLEHDPVYAQATRDAIRAHGLEEYATVLHAPLVEQVVEGKKMLWYDLSMASIPEGIELLVVDGPPDTVQSMARHPAVPLLRGKLASGARVLLDDGGRDDETHMAKDWCRSIPGSTLRFLDLEAGAWLLRMPD